MVVPAAVAVVKLINRIKISNRPRSALPLFDARDDIDRRVGQRIAMHDNQHTLTVVATTCSRRCSAVALSSLPSRMNDVRVLLIAAAPTRSPSVCSRAQSVSMMSSDGRASTIFIVSSETVTMRANRSRM